MGQPTFADLEHQGKTSRELFQERMDGLTSVWDSADWREALSLVSGERAGYTLSQGP